jgi:hypothetical protein
MVNDYQTAFEVLADRGSPRGPFEVYDDAVAQVLTLGHAVDRSGEAAGPVLPLEPNLLVRSAHRHVSWPGPAIAVAAMVLVVVVLGGLILATRGGSPGVGVTPTTEPATPSTEPATPTSSTPLVLGAFELITDGEDFGVEPISTEPDAEGIVSASSSATAAAAGPKGVVAVGSVSGRFNSVAAVWYSPDGQAWERIPHDDDVFGAPTADGNTMLLDVAASGDGFVAVGTSFTGEHTGAVWVSADGRTWDRVAIGFDATSIAATKDGWLAAGGSDGNAAVWSSPDGVNWTEIESGSFHSETHRLMIFDVASDGNTIVAVGGSDAVDHREERPVIWTSTDGTQWSRVTDETGTFDIPVGDGIQTVTAGPNGYVAIGQERLSEGGDPGYGAVWYSPDGLTWQRTRLGDQTVGTIIPSWPVAGPDGYVLLTNSWIQAGPSPQLWTSIDGTSWTAPAPSGVSGFVDGAAVMIDEQLILFGNEYTQEDVATDVAIGPLSIWSAGIQRSIP